MSNRLEMYRSQQMLAESGQAMNQCPHCGSFRLDGLPPALHQRGCPNTGSADPLLYLERQHPAHEADRG